MIRLFTESDLTDVMSIWLDTNIKAHSFVPKEYWINNYASVKEMLPEAEVYVYEDEDTHRITGFIGLTDNYIAGIFIKEAMQSRGIGKQLLNYVKMIKPYLSLSVYQKNVRAVSFYRGEKFVIQSENVDDCTGEKEFIMDWNK